MNDTSIIATLDLKRDVLSELITYLDAVQEYLERESLVTDDSDICTIQDSIFDCMNKLNIITKRIVELRIESKL